MENNRFGFDKKTENGGNHIGEPPFTKMASLHRGKEKKLNANELIEHTSVEAEEVTFSFWKLFMDNWVYVMTYNLSFGSFGVCVGKSRRLRML